MTIIPEKHTLTRLGWALNAQSTGQDETSPSSLSAIRRRMPCEPSPLPQRWPSGLSRPEQLLILQRYLDFPFVPSFVGSSGGIVLDRVVHTLGSRGSRWWATITARLRAQRAWLQHKAGTSTNVLLDPSNYALSINSKGRLSRSLSLQTNIDFDELNQVTALLSGNESPKPLRLQAELKQKVPNHQITAEASLHGRYTDWKSHVVEIPMLLSLGLSSDVRNSGLRYQAGLFQVASNLNADSQAHQRPQVLHLSRFVQSAVTLEKDFSIWKSVGDKKRTNKDKTFKIIKSGKIHEKSLPSSTANFLSSNNKKESQTQRKLPYSTLLNTPYLNFGGVIGLLTQANLHSELRDGSGNIQTCTMDHKRQFWTTKRFFGSAGVNMQLGAFSRRFLDFTSMSLKFDTGMPFQQFSPNFVKNVKYDLGGNSIVKHGLIEKYQQHRHTISASLAQQLFGPVRLRVDGRCDIQFNAETFGNFGSNEPNPIVRLSPSIDQPEMVYGVDIALPYVSGAARLAIWYSPSRKEGLGEIRLL